MMLGFGILAWLMEENGIPVAPAILGMVLGTLLEEHFITSMIKSDGNPLAFFDRPIAGTLAATLIALIVIPTLLSAGAQAAEKRRSSGSLRAHASRPTRRRCLDSMIADVAAQTPDAPAFLHGDRTISSSNSPRAHGARPRASRTWASDRAIAWRCGCPTCRPIRSSTSPASVSAPSPSP